MDFSLSDGIFPVWNAYEILVKRGYDKFVLKDTQDEGDKKNIEIKLNKVL